MRHTDKFLLHFCAYFLNIQILQQFLTIFGLASCLIIMSPVSLLETLLNYLFLTLESFFYSDFSSLLYPFDYP